jgi:hypothetical protein
MEALDLAQTAPRSPREKLLGVSFLPRTIDKFRGELPGGNLAGYFTDYQQGLSSYVLHKLGVSVEDFRALIARAKNEDEVVAWLRDHANISAADNINARLESIRIDTLAPDARATVEKNHPWLKGRTDIVTVLDMLEEDDALTHA